MIHYHPCTLQRPSHRETEHESTTMHSNTLPPGSERCQPHDGPFGGGKTVLVAMLCELQALRVPKSETLSPAVPTAVVFDFMGNKSKLMIVRAHGLSFEREILLIHDKYIYIKYNKASQEAESRGKATVDLD